MLYIINAIIYTPGGPREDAALALDDGRIVAIAGRAAPIPAGATVLDARGLSVVPGLIDLQLNGAFGHDFTLDPATIWAVAAGLPRYGVTAFLPTIITAPPAAASAAQAVLRAGPPAGWRGATPLGLHLEGPFLNPEKKGAHNPAHLRRPTLEAVAGWSPAEHVRLVTLAPELPGALEVIGALAGRGVAVSSGHSTATYAEAEAGIAAGVSYATHLFNAMPALHHREPGLAAAALASPAVVAGLIPDGIHVHPALVRLIWQLTGPERLNLVSDAMAALGMPPGEYQLGDHAVTVGPTAARLADGTLAGSLLAPDEALRNLIAWTGCSLAEALPTLTSTPARLLGLDAELGRIAPGYRADLALLTPANTIACTLVAGEIVYDARTPASDGPAKDELC
jgi:N-acetylglucosamine-6-phosphate deacetylase